MSSFNPRRGQPTPCCTHYLETLYGGSAAWCARSGMVRSMPLWGRVFWLREVGADDEPGPSVGCGSVVAAGSGKAVGLRMRKQATAS